MSTCCPQEKLAYHRRSRKTLSPGLYLGYLKLCTSVEQIRALVPQKLPNILCHTKIRDNSHVSKWDSYYYGSEHAGWKGITSHACRFREEWQWLQTLSCLQESAEMGQDSQTTTHRLQDELRAAIKDLMAHINMPGSQVRVNLGLFQDHRQTLTIFPSGFYISPPLRAHVSVTMGQYMKFKRS